VMPSTSSWRFSYWSVALRFDAVSGDTFGIRPA
jgi:hypothetical protein